MGNYQVQYVKQGLDRVSGWEFVYEEFPSKLVVVQDIKNELTLDNEIKARERVLGGDIRRTN